MKTSFIAIIFIYSTVLFVLAMTINMPRYRQLRVGPMRVKCRLKHDPQPSYAPTTASTYASVESKTEKEEQQANEDNKYEQPSKKTADHSLTELYKSGHHDGYVEGFLEGRKAVIGDKFRGGGDIFEVYNRDEEGRSSFKVYNVDEEDRSSFKVYNVDEEDRSSYRSLDHDAAAGTVQLEGTKVIAEIYREALKQAIDLVRREARKDESRKHRYAGYYRDRPSRYRSQNSRLRGYGSATDRSLRKPLGDESELESHMFLDGKDHRLGDSSSDGKEHYHHVFTSDDRTDMDVMDYFLGVYPDVVVTETSELSDKREVLT